MIIVVLGLPGSGKSYFAEKLANALQASYLNSDHVRQLMHASGKYSLPDKMAVYSEMENQAKKVLDKKQDLVVDATFYRQAMRDMFIRLAKSAPTKIRFIEVVADEALIRDRLKTPRKYSEADFSIYEKVKSEFEEITIPHLRLQSTDRNISSMLNLATQYLQG